MCHSMGIRNSICGEHCAYCQRYPFRCHDGHIFQYAMISIRKADQWPAAMVFYITACITYVSAQPVIVCELVLVGYRVRLWYSTPQSSRDSLDTSLTSGKREMRSWKREIFLKQNTTRSRVWSEITSAASPPLTPTSGTFSL